MSFLTVRGKRGFPTAVNYALQTCNGQLVAILVISIEIPAYGSEKGPNYKVLKKNFNYTLHTCEQNGLGQEDKQ